MEKILIVDDEKSVRYSFSKILDPGKYKLYEAENFDSAMKIFHEINPSLAIVDIEMPGKSGLEVLQAIKSHAPHTPVIMITAFGSSDRVIRAMKFGAYEYIEKPFDIPALIKLIDEALQSTRNISTVQLQPVSKKNREEEFHEDRIIGESDVIKEVYKLIGRVAASDASILVTGESGTGKELVAHAIHKYSDRARLPFIAINCAAIPETLLESELFGYDKGAFTGATRDKPGKFEDAHNGTLFMDEIGDMGLMLQSKLLRVLQEGKVERLGSSRSIKVNVRIIAATNKNLETLISRNLFREDLWYRIRVITISLPPLRMRKMDIPLLVDHFLKKHSHQSRNEIVSMLPETMERIIQQPWPGNIRELENTIKRAIVLSKGNVITPDLIPDAAENTVTATGTSPLSNYLTHEIEHQEGRVFELVTKSVEKDLIIWALNRTGMNQVRAARLLGISRVMLHERMERFGLDIKA
jgi:DNA-binding NtrC family response regulator